MGKFRGCGVAMLTQFKYGKVDYFATSNLANLLVSGGVDFIVPCGTTGESPTLSHEEHEDVIADTVKTVDQKIPVLAGTGSNSLRETMEMTEAALKHGADGAMVVAPYYNKPTAKGIALHFKEVSKIGLPIVLYDIPGRTGIKVSSSQICELANSGYIQGLKWASGDLQQLEDVLLGCPENFDVLSGNDDQAIDCMIRGGHGVISVIGNIIPRQFSSFISLMTKKKWNEAKKVHLDLVPLMRMMFIESNPIPVKTALSIVAPNFFTSELRLPMCEMDDKNKLKLYDCLKKYGLF